MAKVDLNLTALSAIVPSNPYILLALLFSILLLTLIRMAFLFATSPVSPPQTSTPDEKGQPLSANPIHRQRRVWGLTWESLPLTLPVSLTLADKGMPGMGVGLAAVQSPPPPRRGPTFESPRAPYLCRFSRYLLN